MRTDGWNTERESSGVAHNMTKTGIIVSSGRTGTQFLAEYFNKNYDGVVALHEPKPRYVLRVYSNARIAGKVERERMASVLVQNRQKMMRQISCDAYIESNSYLYGFVDVLETVWPNPVIIHVVRDPRTWVRSALNHGNSHGLKKLANRWIPHWLPDVRAILGIQGKLSPVGLFAACWTVMNKATAEYAHAVPNYHLVRFEDLFNESHAGLRALCEIFSLEFRGEGAAHPPSARINVGRSNILGPWDTWPTEQCEELHRICTPLMQAYGYGEEDEWLERAGTSEPSKGASS